MARKERKYHYIYKITNIINNKFYVGMHSTDNLDDGYLGSGKRLWYSLRKYGSENFKLNILEFYPDRISLKNREQELINEDLLKDPMCMNLKYGGEGGLPLNLDLELFHHLGGKAGGKVHANRIKNDPEYAKQHNERWQNVVCNIRSIRTDSNLGYDWTGKKHTDEEKRKIGNKNSIKQRGEKNSQYGTCWINNGIECKKIKREDFNLYSNDWSLGRKF
jgi:hypothetical protein